MDENETTEAVTPVAKKPSGFQNGHVRWSGRKKGSAQRARDLVAELGPGSDPLRYLLSIIHSDSIREPVVDPQTGQPKRHANGRTVYVWRSVSVSEKLEASRTVLPFLSSLL
jgi:hypothetical protein